MIEDFKGKIITDEDVSLPKMEDYFYNSLTPFLKQDEKDSDSIFYIESPLDGEDAVGMSADGTIFTIKTGPGYNVDNNKSAIRIPDLSVYTGINSAYALKINSRKCDVGNVAQNIEYLSMLTNNADINNYVKGKYSLENNISDIIVRLLYTDGPKTPKYTIEQLDKNLVKKYKFKEIKAGLYNGIKFTDSNTHAQPFQAEFDRDGGLLGLDKEPAIREYVDDDDVYIYNNVVQVWPYEAYSASLDTIKESDIGYTDKSGYEGVIAIKQTTNSIKGTNPSKDFFRTFSPNDKLGRCQTVFACISKNHDFPEDGNRDEIGTIFPVGYHKYQFKSIINLEKNADGNVKNELGYLYNRAHLLGNGLSGEGANSRNLVTATSSCNQAQLEYFERPTRLWMEAHPDTKMYYKVTPKYKDDELVPRSILMEALSEDGAYELAYEFNNLEKGIDIYYKTGEAWEHGKKNEAQTDYAKFYVLNNNQAQVETINLAFRIRNAIINKVLNAQDSRICISVNALSRRSDYKAPYDPGFVEPSGLLAKAIQQSATSIGKKLLSDDEWKNYSGFNIYGLDAYGRTLGVVYLKEKDGTWINLNKYVIWYIYNSKTVRQSNFIPDNLTFDEYYKDPTGERFKSWTYDIENINYQDNFWTQLKTLYGQDERRIKLQEMAFNAARIHPNINHDTKVGKDNKKDMNCLKDWTISIGDVSFFCPPSAIRVVTQTQTERFPVLRAKGSMAKNVEKSDTEIELTLFFNNEYGINGQKINVPIWENKDAKISPLKKKVSDEKADYYMNGLRALIAEFKFTPFLPVVNTYLNRTLKIAAVSLEQLDIQTIPNFPRLLKATLRLKDFDYQIYMPGTPELYVPDENSDTNEVENPFALCINYDVMRYYYQKPLQYGNELAAKLDNPEKSGYSINSAEFIKDTMMKNRSVLMPCKFMDPNIDIYIANEDYLKRLLAIKQDAMRRATTGADDNYIPTSDEEKLIREIYNFWISCDVASIYNKYKERRDDIVKLYKQHLPPAKKPFEIEIDGIKYIGDVLVDDTVKNDYRKDGIVYIGHIDRDELKKFVKQQVCDKMFDELKAALKDKKNVNGDPLVKEITRADSRYPNGRIDIRLNIPYTSMQGVGEGLWDQYKKEAKVDTKYQPSLFMDGAISLDLTDIGYEVTTSEPDEPIEYKEENNEYINFITWCSGNAEKLLDANLEAQELKEAMDWENTKSIEYDLVAENVRVDLFESSMANNFARISTLESAGRAPQYTGSSDIHISWKITTKNEEFAMLMKRLPDFEAYCMRRYHLALPCFPIKIDSEFTRMLGVFEVSIEDVVINTVANQPGLYEIVVRAISVDRTLRNREALKSVSNKIDTNKDGQSGDLDNKHLTHSSQTTRVNIKTFDDLMDKMATAEIYPDLELPTIGELGKKGFIFLRYKEQARDKDDLYVDPDFYFYYPFSTKAEVIRNVIQSNFGELGDKNPDSAINRTIVYSDNQGNTGVKFTTKDNKVNIDDANDEYKKSVEKAYRDRIEQSAHISNLDNLESIKNIPAAFIGDAAKWDISTKLSVSFMENFYISLKQLKDTAQDTDEKKDTTTDSKQETQEEKGKAAKAQKKIEKLKELKSFYDDKMVGKDKAIKTLYDFIRKNPIDNGDIKSAQKEAYTISDEAIEALKTKTYRDTLRDMYLDPDEMDKNVFEHFLYAIMDMYSGTKEYNTNLNEQYWKGYYSQKKSIYGYFQNKHNVLEEAKKDTPFDSMKAFGPFEIKVYNYQDLMTFLDEDERKEFNEYIKDKVTPASDINSEKTMLYLLDPYYRYQPLDIQKAYLKACQINVDFAAKAYTRIVLWWLIQLYKADLFPSISMDIMRRNAGNDVKAKEKAQELIEKEYGENNIHIDKTLVKDIYSFVEKNGKAFDYGKIFCAFVMAIYGIPVKDNPIFKLMVKRDYDALNKKISEITSSNYKYRGKVDDKEYLFRKFLLALCGYKEIAGPAYIGRSEEITPAARTLVNHNIKLALEASANPKEFIFHSFYDMCRGDYRGRMLRAFPTFYCMFMDEGKEIGLWKLHDNFYSINSILDISIVKSRKIAADTCTLVLSNNYSTFTTDDEDGYINYKGASFNDLYDSIFRRKKVAEEAEKRRAATNKVNRAKLQPGIRIHIREGYGSDARELACAFNGVIASVQPNAQAINIVAQGNGIELMNQIMEDRDADEIQYIDQPGDALNNTDGGGATPATILKSFLTTKGGYMKKYFQGKANVDQWACKGGVKDTDDDSWLSLWAQYIADVWNSNPYGIVHFGDPDYKDVFPGGEIIQNIYEVSALPNMDDNRLILYSDSNDCQQPPYISFEPQGKTMWDVLHICKSVAPDYVVGTASFGLRDTIFFGKPHYYYAYDYQKYNGVIVEKRKPFQQYHFLFSDSDIIVNNITASSDKIKNVATGLFKDQYGTGIWSYTKNRDVGPLWVDSNIYPESQKSMIVDTRLKMKSATKVNKGLDGSGSFGMAEGIGNFGRNVLQTVFNTLPVTGLLSTLTSYLTEEFMGPMFDDKGQFSHHKRIAWSSTANELKESMKEMYQGEISIIGTPSIKPNDRIYLRDQYNDMSGMVLVRDVVHNLSATTGFTTTIHVDTISCVDDKDEMTIQNYGQFLAGQVIATLGLNVFLHWKCNSGLKILDPMIGKAQASTAKLIKKTFESKQAIISSAKKATDLAKDAKFISKAIALTKGNAIKAVATVGAIAIGGELAIAAAFLTIAKYVVIDMIAQGILGGINDYLLFIVKNHRVLQIFPLKKNGMVYTAGLDGHIGSVYGSPTYGQCGPLEKVFNLLFADSKEESYSIAQLFRAALCSPELREEAAKYSQDLRYASKIGKDSISTEAAIDSVAYGTMSQPGFKIHKKNSFDLSLGNRAIVKNKDKAEIRALSTGYSRYYIEKVDDILTNSSKKNQLLISQYQGLAFYKRIGFLELLHDKIALDELKKIKHEELEVMLSGEKTKINAIRHNGALDVPFLSKDGLIVLKDICDTCFKSLEIDNTKDDSSIEKALNGTKIIVTSALMIGAKNKACGAGYSFCVRGTGQLDNGVLKQDIEKYRQDVQTKLDELNKDGDENNKEVCWYLGSKSNDVETRIMVNPESPFAGQKYKIDSQKQEAADKK